MLERIKSRAMRLLLWVPAGLLFMFSSCSEQKVDEAEVAGNAARLYYEYLLQGKYDAYVDGFHRPDSIPGSYRAQLIDNAKMFMALQRDEHKGIKSVGVSMVRADTASHTANVFLMLEYGDKVSEQIVVPMIREKGIWLMR